MAPRVAIIFYSMYGHIETLANAEAEGIRAAGGTVDLYRLPETLPDDVLQKMQAPSKDVVKIPTLSEPMELTKYDAFLFGIPTRYGNFPTQWKSFWDSTGQLWMSGGLHGKYAGLFVSTAGLGGGQESTAIASMSTLVHHGMRYVPLGFADAKNELGNLSELHGGSPWGAGTFAGPMGDRQPTELELKIAKIQGESFYKEVTRINFA